MLCLGSMVMQISGTKKVADISNQIWSSL